MPTYTNCCYCQPLNRLFHIYIYINNINFETIFTVRYEDILSFSYAFSYALSILRSLLKEHIYSRSEKRAKLMVVFCVSIVIIINLVRENKF